MFDFLRIRTWIEMDKAAVGSEAGQEVVRDSMELAALEGLVGHLESAACRMKSRL